jgi:hypothetical protein
VALASQTAPAAIAVPTTTASGHDWVSLLRLVFTGAAGAAGATGVAAGGPIATAQRGTSAQGSRTCGLR